MEKENRNQLVVCADGFKMSVQANQYAYCAPRSDNADRYVEVEVGFPSDYEELFDDYVEMKDSTKSHQEQVVWVIFGDGLDYVCQEWLNKFITIYLKILMLISKET